ncbi:hypothetical protein GCM10009700_27680 [Brevibacterium sanguinis]
MIYELKDEVGHQPPFRFDTMKHDAFDLARCFTGNDLDSLYQEGEVIAALDRLERQDMVRMLSDEGMSTRAIAPIVGASDRQVRRDVSGGTNVPPDPTPPHVNTDTGEIIDEPVKTTGMDGKQYSRPNRSDSTLTESDVKA